MYFLIPCLPHSAFSFQKQNFSEGALSVLGTWFIYVLLVMTAQHSARLTLEYNPQAWMGCPLHSWYATVFLGSSFTITLGFPLPLFGGVFYFLYPITSVFLDYSLCLVEVSSSSFLRSGAWEINIFLDLEYLKIILFYNLIWHNFPRYRTVD